MSAEDIRVSYGVKELLSRIDNRLESIDNKLDKKVDDGDFELLIQRVEATVRRVDALDSKWETRIALERARTEENTTTFSKREKTMALLIASVAVVVQFIPYIPHIGGGHS